MGKTTDKAYEPPRLEVIGQIEELTQTVDCSISCPDDVAP
jgi:hypothetical protein